MKISGIAIIRNGVEFDYPFLESLRSLLPLVDELIINVGISGDKTLEEIKIFCATEGKGKASFFESHWPFDDPQKRKDGIILSEQTNLALDRATGDWCIYLQSDEVLHEADYLKLKTAFKNFHADPKVDGLLFNYLHFYGSYDVVQQTRSAYRREVRAFKRASTARSVGDAQSFRKTDGSKLNVARCDARVFHYGWVRTPDAMKEKTLFMDKLYHSGDSSQNADGEALPHTGMNYRYKRFWGLRKYNGSHPQTMQERIEKKGWSWDLKNSPYVWEWKDLKKVILDSFEKITGYRLFEYKSYRIVDSNK